MSVQLSLEMPVGEIASANFAALEILLANNVDFYCLHDRPLREALADAGADAATVLEQLNKTAAQPPTGYPVDIANWPLDLLAQYIQRTHHVYTEQVTAALRTKTDAYLESGREKALATTFSGLLNAIRGEMSVHMKREELTFFPLMRKLVAQGGGTVESTRFKSFDEPIAQFLHEHDVQHDLLKKIRALFANYTLDTGADAALGEIIGLMQDLARDLALHLHLENNILFPRAVALEKKLRA